MKKITGNRFMQGFCIVVLILAIGREIVTTLSHHSTQPTEQVSVASDSVPPDSTTHAIATE